MSVVFTARPVLLTAAGVYVAWRVIVWRRRGGDVVREAVVGVLFVWSLVVVRLTFFPLIIIFYDWYGSANFVPFASIIQLITETPASVAFENIVGNLVLFVPFGFLLPVLFGRLRSVRALAWRAAMISASIEVVQHFTRARSIDVDDIILNTIGAVLGYGVFVAIARLTTNSARVSGFLARVGATGAREPLLTGIVPIAVTVLLVVPVMISSLVSGTLGGRSGDLARDAASLWPGGAVVASTDVDRYRFVAVTDGPTPSVVGLVAYQTVLPGRVTRLSWGDIPFGENTYAYRITVFNVTRDEVPVVAMWGSTDGTASSVRVNAPGYSGVFDLTADPYFVFGFEYDVEANRGAGDLLDFDLLFLDAAGNDVTSSYLDAYE